MIRLQVFEPALQLIECVMLDERIIGRVGADGPDPILDYHLVPTCIFPVPHKPFDKGYARGVLLDSFLSPPGSMGNGHRQAVDD